MNKTICRRVWLNWTELNQQCWLKERMNMMNEGENEKQWERYKKNILPSFHLEGEEGVGGIAYAEAWWRKTGIEAY